MPKGVYTRTEAAKEAVRKAARSRPIRGHGHARKSGVSPTWSSWKKMRARCRPGGEYFDRGIRVCDRWQDFENFLADMGERPTDGLWDIHRVDHSRGYEPGNCEWARHGTHRDYRHSEETKRKISEDVRKARSRG